MIEKNYDFRQFLDQIHQRNLRDFSLMHLQEETVIDDSWAICIPENASVFVENAAKDFADYLLTSMSIGNRIIRGSKKADHVIIFRSAADLKVKRSFRLICSAEQIIIEDVMTMREAPFVPQTKGLVKEPLFSPRMVHSGYGMDVFTENYLKRIAHAGFDAILVYVRADPLTGTQGPYDFAPLIDLAENAGLDVYLYSGIKNIYHPSDREADAYYEAQYGGLFKRYPKAKGLILAGESCQFPSHDPHTTGNIVSCGEPCFRSGKSRPGWWPCSDFPEFVSLLKSKIRRYAPHADVVFWTYNFSQAPEKLRIDLIDRLPKDIAIEVNYEQHDNIRIWGTQERPLDYTLSATGPSRLFQAESEAVKRNGQRLYAMVNTAGKTWDFGSVPYLPALQQWGKRMTNMLLDRQNKGLSGIMESHHFGWWMYGTTGARRLPPL